MLTLADRLQIGALTVYRDVQQGPDGRRHYTSVFYPVPLSPRLAVDAQGQPSLYLLWYRVPAGTAASHPLAAKGGGILTVTVELALTADEERQTKQEIARRLPDIAEDAIELRALPVVDGSVLLSFAGESPRSNGEESAGPPTTEGNDLALRALGTGPASLTGHQRATFLVELSQDGAALLWQALHMGQCVLHASYELRVEFLLDLVRLRLWCDVQKAWPAVVAAAALKEAPTSTQLAARLRDLQLAGYEIVSPVALPPAHTSQLESLAQQLMAAALHEVRNDLQHAVGSGGAHGGSAPAGLALSLNHTFTESYSAVQTETLSTALRPQLDPDQLAQHVCRVDLQSGAFPVLQVQVICCADFSAGLLSAVHVQLEYDETGPSGRIQRSAEFLFRDSLATGQFRIDLASPDKNQYRCTALVYYSGSAEPTKLMFPPSSDSVLVLNLAQLGILQVEVALGDMPLDIVKAVRIELALSEPDVSQTYVLDAGTPLAMWQVVVRTTPLPPYRYRATWIFHDDHRHEGAWQESSAPRLYIGPPPSLGQAAQVLVLAAGDFSALSQAVVRIGVQDQDATYSFTAPGQSYTFRPTVMDRALLQYRAQLSLIYRDGTVAVLPATDEDRPVFIVRDVLRFDVHVLPRLLDLGGTLGLAILTLEALDGAGIPSQRKNVTLSRRDEDVRWSFRIPAPDQHRYRYQLTLIPKVGPRSTSDWQTSTDEVLVLTPPSAH